MDEDSKCLCCGAGWFLVSAESGDVTFKCGTTQKSNELCPSIVCIANHLSKECAARQSTIAALTREVEALRANITAALEVDAYEPNEYGGGLSKKAGGEYVMQVDIQEALTRITEEARET